ncbi:hypothetical protein NAT51_05120 [Flavobacterium amniphilum]|uniref:hypothetical protein n=1 Tax=Flavobacterium amniphilum TaxID=1834035 RepID=UPI002029F8C0|nr:hypothetical protein [Flavobacterium amniphilum]MCL9804889.1 hypothetical protein [Flavobacterium amniphilum]
MKPKNLAELSDQELLQKSKTLKTGKIIDAVLVGFTIGIVIYSAVKSGLGFFTFFPLLITYVVIKNSKNNAVLAHEIRNELKSRKLVENQDEA